MILQFSSLSWSPVNLVFAISLVYLLRRLLNCARFIRPFLSIPRDTNGSFLFGDLLTFFPHLLRTDPAFFRRNMTDFMVRMCNLNKGKSGLFTIWLGWIPLPFLCNHEAAEVLMANTVLSKPSYYQRLGLAGTLIVPRNEWKLHRKMIEPFFVTKQQRSFVQAMDRVFNSLINDRLVQQVSISNEPVFMRHHIHQAALDIICHLTVRIPLDWNKTEKEEIIESIDQMEQIAMNRILNPLTWTETIFSRTKVGPRWVSCVETLYSFFGSQITKLSDGRKNFNDTSEDDVNWSDFVQVLSSTVTSNKPSIDFKMANEELVTMIIGGHETTSMSLMWTLFLLGNHMHIQDKLYQEIVSVFPSHDPVNDIDKLNRCVYLDQCVKESLRLYPPIVIIGRKLEKSITISGFRLPQGTELVLDILSCQRDPKIYPNPDQFDPNRFAPGNLAKIPKGAYIPFGLAPRNCVGYRLAYLEMKVFLAHMIRRFQIVSAKKPEEVQFVYEITLKPSIPLDFILNDRSTI